MDGNEIAGLADPQTDQSAEIKKYVDALVRGTMALLDDKVLQIDGSKAPTHDIRWGNHRISDLANPKALQDAATKAYVENAIIDELARVASKIMDLLDAKVLQLDGSKAPTHDIRWGNHRISELADPKAPQDAATKAYVHYKR